MSQTPQPIRGMHDLIDDAYRQHDHIIRTFFDISHRFAYKPIATPIVEALAVFAKSLGDSSDIVGKEMYHFTDKGGEAVVLRPEGTAAIVRAAINNGMLQQLPLRLAYSGAMFRYERPQKGRQRQFHQVGCELFAPASPAVDVEMLAFAWQFLTALNLTAPYTLEINTLGDAASREAYRGALVAYLSQHRQALSADSQERLTKNPLRILDSKAEQDKALLVDAPKMADYLTIEAKTFFDAVQEGLGALDIPYTLNPHLVRGLDYYSHTAFEVTTPALGAQATILAGGRYDGLVAQMGGQPTNGVGFGAGIERLALLLPPLPAAPASTTVIALHSSLEPQVARISQQLRQAGLRVENFLTSNPKKALEKASKRGCGHAVLLGEAEWAAGQVLVKDFNTSQQQAVGLNILESFFKASQSVSQF